MKINKYIAFISSPFRRSIKSKHIHKNIEIDPYFNKGNHKLKIDQLSPAHKKNIMASLITNENVKDLIKDSSIKKSKRISSQSPRQSSMKILKQYNFSDINDANPSLFTNEEIEKFNAIMKNPFEQLEYEEEELKREIKMFVQSSAKPIMSRQSRASHTSHYKFRKIKIN